MEDSQSNGKMSDNTNLSMANVTTNLHNNSAKTTNASVDLTTPPLTPPRHPSPLDGPSRKMPPLQPSSPVLVQMEEVEREEEKRGGNFSLSHPPALVVCEDIGSGVDPVEGNKDGEKEDGQLLEEEKELLEGEEGEVVGGGVEADGEQQLLKGGEEEKELLGRQEEELLGRQEQKELLGRQEEKELLGRQEEKELLGQEEEKELLGQEEEKELLGGEELDEGEEVGKDQQLLEREEEEEYQLEEADRKHSEGSTSPQGDDESLALVIDVPEPSGLPLIPSPLDEKLATISNQEAGISLPQSDPDVAHTNGVVSLEAQKVRRDSNDKEEELMEISLELPSSDEDSSVESESGDESQSITVIKKATPPLLCEGRKLEEMLPESANAVRQNPTEMKGRGEEGGNPKPVEERPTQVFSDGILGDEEVEGNLATPNVHQVAKLKRFFTTLQQFGNKMSSEVAEQVQELITALVVSVLGIRERGKGGCEGNEMNDPIALNTPTSYVYI